MGVFESTKTFASKATDLAPIGQSVVEHFSSKGFEVSQESTITGGQYLSIHQGGVFRAVVGLKTALNIAIEPIATGTSVRANVGIFGTQAIPTAISMLIFWPLLVTQLWGMIQQANLDEEAMLAVEQALQKHGALVAMPVPAGSAAMATTFCTKCGAAVDSSSRFCSQCGAPMTQ
jgi:hypothetical protein